MLEDDGIMFFRNVGNLLPSNAASPARRMEFRTRRPVKREFRKYFIDLHDRIGLLKTHSGYVTDDEAKVEFCAIRK